MSVASQELPTRLDNVAPMNIFTEEVDPTFPNSWFFRSPFIDMAFGKDPPLFFIDAKQIIPPIPIPLPITVYYPMAVGFGFAGAIGFSTGDGLMLISTQEVMFNGIRPVIPEEIKGNAYLSGTVVRANDS